MEADQTTSHHETTQVDQQDVPYDTLPTDHFRLLQFKENEDGRIHLSMSTISMIDPVDYWALSYTWGPAENLTESSTSTDSTGSNETDAVTHTIFLNGWPMEVTQNLFDFLDIVLGPTDANSYLWVDALCINQNNISERTAQVNLMDMIYAQARNVYVWLGKADEHTPRVFHLIECLGKRHGTLMNTYGSLDSLGNMNDPFDATQAKELGLDSFSQEDFNRLFRFLQHRWFYRNWTISEATLATGVVGMCGSLHIRWTYLNRAFEIIGSTSLSTAILHKSSEAASNGVLSVAPTLTANTQLRMLIYASKDTLQDSHGRLFRNSYGVGDVLHSTGLLLEYCLGLSRNTACADPRDRVFATLGMVKKITSEKLCATGAPKITANYEKSVKTVYTETMTYVLEWVADLTTPFVNAIIERQYLEIDFEPCDASKQASVGFDIHGDVLSVHQSRYSKVIQISEAWDDFHTKASFRKFAKLAVTRARMNPDHELRVDELWQTMICGVRSISQFKSFSEDEVRISFSRYMYMLTLDLMVELASLEGEDSITHFRERLKWQICLADMDDTNMIPDPRHVWEDIQTLWSGKGSTTAIDKQLTAETTIFQQLAGRSMRGGRLILLETGEIGLCNHDVRPGDTISIFADGGLTPFIVRKIDGSSSNSWSLISPAYVRDIMHGEAVDQMKKHGRTWEKIDLI